MRWTQRIEDPNIWRVYWATVMLGLAYGMAISVIAIYLDGRGFEKQAIGSLAAWFAGGIVTASLPMGLLIKRFSAKSVLTLCFFGYALAVGVFPLLDSYPAIAGIRFLDGAFSVGIWVGSETILLFRSGKHHKAFVMSLYAAAIAFGYITGPLIAHLMASVLPLATAFYVASVLACAAGIYGLTRLAPDHERPAGSSSHEDELAGPQSPVGSILWQIKNSCFATFSYGYFQSSVVLFLPLYLIESKGIPEHDTILIPMFFAAGMLLFTNVAGRLGDRFGHLLLMRGLAVVGAVTILAFVFLNAYPLMCAAVFVAGATLASISPVSLALQGVILKGADYARATSVYNTFYAAGMLLGPPISSLIFQHVGGASMLYHLAGLWACFVVFTLIFYRDDPAAGGPPSQVDALT